MHDSDEVARWAASGAMSLTGRRGGPPRVSPGRPAGSVAEYLGTVARCARERTGRDPELPGLRLIGERAAILGISRRGPWSCGGSFRALRTEDGWFGLNLARDEDQRAVGALVESAGVDDQWAAASAWASGLTTEAAVTRGRVLDLPCDGWPRLRSSDRPGVSINSGGGTRRVVERPLIVDLSSLWAGPLCANLLGLTGCTVVKVEDVGRPDGTRRGQPAFFDLLHSGHYSVALDLPEPR